MKIFGQITKEESQALSRGETVTIVSPFDSLMVAVEGEMSRDAKVIAANVTKDSRAKVTHQLFVSVRTAHS